MSRPGPQSPFPETAWQLAKALFICGVSLNDAAARAAIPVTAVAKRSQREAWHAVRLQLGEADVVHADAVKADAYLSDLSGKLRHILATDLHKTMLQMKRCRMAGTTEGLAERANLQRTLISNASEIFGWHNQSGNTTVNIALLSGETRQAQDGALQCSTDVPHGTIDDAQPTTLDASTIGIKESLAGPATTPDDTAPPL